MPSSRVFVGGLSHGARERDLEKFFKGFGRVRDVLIKNGYGFVEFEDYRDADDAVYELNGKELLGERVVVEPARGIDRGDRFRRNNRDSGGGGRDRDRYDRGGRGGGGGRSRNNEYGPPTRTNYRLIVENLSSRISWQDLKDHMRQAGEVTYADAHKLHKNEGVVEFKSHSDMKAALEKLDGSELSGRKVRLVEDKRSSRRRGSRSSSRSRSRSPRKRSRSRSRSRSSRSRSKSRGKSPAAKSRSRSPSKDRASSREAERRSADKDRSRSRERSRSKKETPAREGKARSRTASRSRSRSRDGGEPASCENGRGSNDRSPRSGD